MSSTTTVPAGAAAAAAGGGGGGGGGDGAQLLRALLADNAAAAKTFATPLPLGVKRKLSIVTCMDSRLLLDRLLPSTIGVGDAEIIRNAGGRVTPDVMRSLFVAQEVPELSTRAVIIIHHTDCGAQAAVRHHDLLMHRMRALTADWLWPLGWLLQAVTVFFGGLLPGAVRRALLRALLTRAFDDPAAALHTDVWLLRNAPLHPHSTPIHGLLYDVKTGRLTHVVTSACAVDK